MHYQWLTLEPLDSLLLARGAPRVFTAHNVLRRGDRSRRAAGRAGCSARMDARDRPHRGGRAARCGPARGRPAPVHVIPHGAFDYLARQEREEPLPAELAAVEGPVVLCFGILRPYKGVDVLVEAFREIEGAELWIVGRPVDGHRRRCARPPPAPGARCGSWTGSCPTPQLPALFRRADVVTLPYRRIDQSGVLYTALAFGKAMVLSDVGGFGEVGRVDGAAELVPPGDPEALREALAGLLADPGRAGRRWSGPPPRPRPAAATPGTPSAAVRWSSTRS